MNDNTRIRIHLSGKLFESLTKQIILESKKSKKIIKKTSDGALGKTKKMTNIETSEKKSEKAKTPNKPEVTQPEVKSPEDTKKTLGKGEKINKANEKKYKGPSAKQSEKADQTKPKPKVGKVMEKKTIDNKKKA